MAMKINVTLFSIFAFCFILPTSSLAGNNNQIQVDTKFVEVSDNFSEEIGADFRGLGDGEISGGMPDFTTNSDQKISDELPGTEPTLNASQKAFGDNVGLTDPQLEVILRATEKDTNAETLSAPKIQTLNNQRADLAIGTQNPSVPTSFSENPNSAGVIKLEVTPQVSGDGSVTMNVNPVSGDLPEVITIQLPVFDTRNVRTRFLVGFGPTVVIGGLISKEPRQSDGRVPNLGNISYIGRLFKNVGVQRNSNNLQIFVTPRIMTPQE